MTFTLIENNAADDSKKDSSEAPKTNASAPAPAPQASKEQVLRDILKMTSETLGKDLLQALLQEVKLLPEPWAKLPKARQDDVIDRLRERVINAATMAVHIIAAEGKTAVTGTLEQITIKDEVKAVVKFAHFATGLHELYEYTGKSVMLVVANANQHTGGMDEIKGEADQRAMDLGHEYDPKADGQGMAGNIDPNVGGSDPAASAFINGVLTIEHTPEPKPEAEPEFSAAMKRSKAYRDGRRAAKVGKTKGECPYADGSDHFVWISGWEDWHVSNGGDSDGKPAGGPDC